jgi:hypothetical protein
MSSTPLIDELTRIIKQKTGLNTIPLLVSQSNQLSYVINDLNFDCLVANYCDHRLEEHLSWFTNVVMFEPRYKKKQITDRFSDYCVSRGAEYVEFEFYEPNLIELRYRLSVREDVSLDNRKQLIVSRKVMCNAVLVRELEVNLGFELSERDNRQLEIQHGLAEQSLLDLDIIMDELTGVCLLKMSELNDMQTSEFERLVLNIKHLRFIVSKLYVIIDADDELDETSVNYKNLCKLCMAMNNEKRDHVVIDDFEFRMKIISLVESQQAYNNDSDSLSLLAYTINSLYSQTLRIRQARKLTFARLNPISSRQEAFLIGCKCFNSFVAQHLLYSFQLAELIAMSYDCDALRRAFPLLNNKIVQLFSSIVAQSMGDLSV